MANNDDTVSPLRRLKADRFNSYMNNPPYKMAIGPALSLPIVRQLSHCGPGLLHNGTRGGLRDCTNRGTRRGLGILKGVCAGIEYPPRVAHLGLDKILMAATLQVISSNTFS